MATYAAHAPQHAPDISQLPDCGLLRLPPVLALCGLSRSTFLDQVKKGYAPQPVRLGPRACAWRIGDLRKYLNGEWGKQ